MKSVVRTSLRLVLATTVLAGTLAPAFAFVAPGAPVVGPSQASDAPKVLVRGGARYHQLHNPRVGDRDGLGREVRERAPRNAGYGMRYGENFGVDLKS